MRFELYRAIQDDELSAHDLTQPNSLETLHREINKSIWQWAGMLRKTGLSIGIDPRLIRQELYQQLDTLQWRVDNMDMHGLSPEAVAMGAHHTMVWIHPFVDGNGRSTRLYADLLLFALTGDRVFEWSEDPLYYAALKRADSSRDVSELLEIVGVEVL
ncbi:Fic family protein [Subtercola frigoramans]|uniref:Fido (Protein-threonine AMPylation protein) n=1 Tax=Subtercola frigoramans TaxID=120298 RepID=A0ABS2L838_9MICO|nr:Fic family protein [Subtercola frigoramans]MBM7473149.1 fido (protein-threonine AMPylation protein) [Subtercola frigoramans]